MNNIKRTTLSKVRLAVAKRDAIWPGAWVVRALEIETDLL
jgi:hypothetical protein